MKQIAIFTKYIMAVFMTLVLERKSIFLSEACQSQNLKTTNLNGIICHPVKT